MRPIRQTIIAILCFLTGIGAYLLTPHELLADIEPVNLEEIIPLNFGDWHAEPQADNIVVSAEQDAFIKSIYSQVLTRVYVDNADHRVMLSIAYTRNQSDNSGTQSHKPEICYPAQGFVINSITKNNISTRYGVIATKRLITSNGSRYEPLSYWTMVGEYSALSVVDTKIAQIKYGINNMMPDGLIFRVSTIGIDETESFKLQEKFVAEMIEVLSENNRVRLTGLRHSMAL